MTCIVWHSDCLDVKGRPLQSLVECDHVITDPPYGEHTHKAQRQGCTGYTEPTRPGAQRAQFNRNREIGFDHLDADTRQQCAREFARIAKRWVLIFTDHEGSIAWGDDLSSAGLDVVRYGIWRKLGSTPQFTGDRPAQGHEVIVIAHQPGRKRWNGGGRHAVREVPIVLNRGAGGEQRVHTTQKPLALMEALVRDFTDPGDLIVDPFAGSGTTGVACKRLGRSFIGIERDEKYAAVAAQRHRDASEQGDLFEADRGKRTQGRLEL